MSIGEHGENLLFLVAQPRAGSTLLQRLLMNHPEIGSVQEPGLLLPLLGPLNGAPASSGAPETPPAVQLFVRGLPRKEECYREGVRRMAAHLYEAARAGSGKRLFLDRTPGYYRILAQLAPAFPRARVLVLLRNPLAVLVSVLRHRIGEDWFSFASPAVQADLLEAPRILHAHAAPRRDPGIVRYEELLLTPHTVLHRLCDWLGLEFSPGLAEGPLPAQEWELGDARVRRQETIDAGNAERWQAALRDPQVWRLCRNYRDLLGPGVLDGLGYASSGLDQILRAAQPAPSRLSLTYSWEALVAPRRAPRKALLRARRVLQRALLPRK